MLETVVLIYFFRTCDILDKLKVKKNSFYSKYRFYVIWSSLSVKTQLKSFLEIYYFLHKIILYIVKNILWKYIIGIFNIDWVRPCQRLKS